MFLPQEEKKLAYKTKLRELNVELTSDNEDEDDLTWQLTASTWGPTSTAIECIF